MARRSQRLRGVDPQSFPAPRVDVPGGIGSTLVVAGLLLASGACALVYQVAWLRMLRLVFGYSTAASAAVLAIFMGGLGVGGVRLGRRADRVADPLRLYALLELGIAAAAAPTPFLVDGVQRLYAMSGGSALLGIAGATVIRLAMAAAVLALPTYWMGGTLSAAARAVESASGGRKRTALLYGANTIGAVCGVVLANFLLLERLGTRATLRAAVVANVGLALVALLVSRRQRSQVGVAVASAMPPPPAALPRQFVSAAAALAGFAFLLMEITWYRMLSPLLGGSTYTFGLILAMALFGIGTGGIAYALVPTTSRPASAGRLAVVSAAEALFAIVPFALGDRIALLAILLQPLSAGGFAALVGGWSVIAAIVVLPMAIVSGYQFPLLIGLAGTRVDKVGTEVGRVYAFNTAGAIAGSLAGGFGLLPMLGASGVWRGVAVALAVLALAATWISLRRGEPKRSSVLASMLLLAAAVGCFAVGPTAVWRHSPIGAGVTRSFGGSPNELQYFLNNVRRSLRWETDGVESSVARTDVNGISLMMNGKSDGNVVADASTMIMSGMLPALFHDEPRRALVIGMGLGMTAGWLAHVPSIERVDVVELEPAVVRLVREAAPSNRDVLENPKVRIVIEDAREHLLATRERYDIIASEPSNPYRAGVASLFTVEFYRAARAALNPGGLFAQWVQAYAVEAATIRTVYATVGTVFPAIDSWEVQLGNDLLLLASRQPLRHDLARLAQRLEADPFREAVHRGWGVEGIEGLYTGFVAGPQMARDIRAAARSVRLNTDDATVIEFEFARGLARLDAQLLRHMRDAAGQRPGDAPAIISGAVDWDAVREQRAVRALHEGKPFSSEGFVGDNDARGRIQARQAYAAEDLAGSRLAWLQQRARPANPTDRVMLAESLAEAGDPRVFELIEAVHRNEPVDAELIAARYYERSGDVIRSARHLAAGFERARQSPWGSQGLMRRGLHQAWRLAASHPDSVAPLLAALRQPFASAVLEDRRVFAYASIALHQGPPLHCASALAPIEPWVLWDGSFLARRAECYERVAHPLASRARQESARYRTAAGTDVAEVLGLTQHAK